MPVWNEALGRWQVQWRDYTAQEIPATSTARQWVRRMQVGAFSQTRWMLMPTLRATQTWPSSGRVNFEIAGYETYGLNGSGFYSYGGNEGFAQLSSFGANVSPDGSGGLNFINATAWSQMEQVFDDWGTNPTVVGPTGGSAGPGTDQVTAAINTPTLAVVGTSTASLLAAMTATPATTSAAATTLAWLDGNPDNWSWVKDDRAAQVAPIPISMYHRLYPHGGANRYGVMVGTFLRAAGAAPAWVKWRKRIIPGLDRGFSFNGYRTLTIRHVVEFGSLWLASGHHRSNNSDVLHYFYHVSALDGTPITSTAELKALCGINATMPTTYGIPALWNVGSPIHSGAGDDGAIRVGPGGTLWQGRYPVDYPTPPATGVSRGKGFRMRVIAHDVDNGSSGTLPNLGSTTYADVDAMIDAGFVEVAAVEFWPEDFTGPTLTFDLKTDETIRADIDMTTGARIGGTLLGGAAPGGADGGRF